MLLPVPKRKGFCIQFHSAQQGTPVTDTEAPPTPPHDGRAYVHTLVFPRGSSVEYMALLPYKLLSFLQVVWWRFVVK